MIVRPVMLLVLVSLVVPVKTRESPFTGAFSLAPAQFAFLPPDWLAAQVSSVPPPSQVITAALDVSMKAKISAKKIKHLQPRQTFLSSLIWF